MKTVPVQEPFMRYGPDFAGTASRETGPNSMLTGSKCEAELLFRFSPKCMKSMKEGSR